MVALRSLPGCRDDFSFIALTSDQGGSLAHSAENAGCFTTLSKWTGRRDPLRVLSKPTPQAVSSPCPARLTKRSSSRGSMVDELSHSTLALSSLDINLSPPLLLVVLSPAERAVTAGRPIAPRRRVAGRGACAVRRCHPCRTLGQAHTPRRHTAVALRCIIECEKEVRIGPESLKTKRIRPPPAVALRCIIVREKKVA